MSNYSDFCNYLKLKKENPDVKYPTPRQIEIIKKQAEKEKDTKEKYFAVPKKRISPPRRSYSAGYIQPINVSQHEIKIIKPDVMAIHN